MNTSPEIVKIHVFGSLRKETRLYWESNYSLLCVCVCVGAVFSLRSSFFICFFRQKAAIVFHSLKARKVLNGDEGEGTEAFLVNNAERSLLIGCLMCAPAFICLFVYFSDVFWKNLTRFL